MAGQPACLACDLSEGRAPLPGGVIHEADGWRIEHCIGPLGVGTLIVKPTRHVEHVADLTDTEAAEFGPLLRTTSAVVASLTPCEQVYVCLWSHGPVHLHFVVQPETKEAREQFRAHGPALQLAMFQEGVSPDEADVESLAARAREQFAALS